MSEASKKKYRLNSDVFSVFYKGNKPIQYGARWDLVTEVSDRGNVVIVEAKDGRRFPVKKEKLIEQST